MKKLLNLLILITINILLVGCGDGTIKVPKSSSDYTNMNYKEVATELKEAGFTNITYTSIDDLKSNSAIADGSVVSVKVNGIGGYSKRDKYQPDVPIEIIYHNIPKVYPPINSKDIQNYIYTEIAHQFIEKGFVNVTASEINDLDPDTLETDFINNVYVNNKAEFDVEDAVAFDAPVNIIGHFPYVKYDVKLSIDFNKNLLFNKYGVNVAVDDENVAKLAHGESKDIDIRLKKGQHKITFSNVKDESLKKVFLLNVSYNVIAGYKLNCESEELEATEMYIDYLVEVGKDKAKVMWSNDDFYGANYKTVKAEFADLGFKNIKTVPLYDIVFGITDEESVEDVTINGKSTFRRGDIYDKNVEIVITYHMYSADDPDKK